MNNPITQSPPNNMDEYNVRFYQNYKVTGFGLGVTINTPCPSCAAPNFMQYKLMAMDEISSKEHICAECDRGFVTIIEHAGNVSGLQIVQTRGPDMQDWHPIKFQRVVNK